MTVTIIGNNTGDDYLGTDDTYARSDLSVSIFNTDTVLKVTKFSAVINTVSFVRFSGLSNIPATDTISDVSLFLSVNNTSVPANTTATLRRILLTWIDSQTSWTNRLTGTPWTSGGARSLGNDISSTVTGTILIDSIGYKSVSTAQLISDTQGMVNGSLANDGWHFDRTDAGNDSTFTDLDSSEGIDGSRPYIIVTHTSLPPPTPNENQIEPVFGGARGWPSRKELQKKKQLKIDQQNKEVMEIIEKAFPILLKNIRD